MYQAGDTYHVRVCQDKENIFINIEVYLSVYYEKEIKILFLQIRLFKRDLLKNNQEKRKRWFMYQEYGNQQFLNGLCHDGAGPK